MNTTDKTVYYTNTNTINVCKANIKKTKEEETIITEKEKEEGNQDSPEDEDTHLEDEDTHLEDENQGSTDIKSYSSVVKKVKKDNITADNIGEIMLCQIPGISSTTAGAIMTHFDGSLHAKNSCLTHQFSA